PADDGPGPPDGDRQPRPEVARRPVHTRGLARPRADQDDRRPGGDSGGVPEALPHQGRVRPGMGDGLPASVIVVNWNGRHFLADCLAALERQTVPRRRYEILLIDNGSTDGSGDFVRARFPGVRVYAAGANLGFAAANNLGFRLARGRHVVLLNNDTRVEPGWLAGLLAAAGGPGVGGVAS